MATDLWRASKFTFFQAKMGPWVGVKPEIFQGIGGFVESEHSDKYFIKKKKRPSRENLGVFVLDTLKTTPWIENWLKDGQNQGPFFQN